jgi:hypothetical protein
LLDSDVGKLDNEDARVLRFRARRWLTSNRHVLISGARFNRYCWMIKEPRIYLEAKVIAHSISNDSGIIASKCLGDLSDERGVDGSCGRRG